ncbi:MAG TPA: hypothetical protein VHE53_02850 [Patescibacteria group bacterium]|nr:hypothetical protein [Patescibacteria group bacterium]
MKKTFLILTITLLLMLGVSKSYAVTPTPTAAAKTTPAKTTPTKIPEVTEEENQIEKIKDLVASKVAELNLVDKRGLIGTVKSTTNTQITITDDKNTERQIDIDELTKFDSGDDKNTDFGISDIKKGDLFSFIGLFNKETKRLLARFVSKAKNVPENIEGVITNKDAKNYTFDLVTEAGKKYTVNVETSTKTSDIEDGDLTKSGFSKIDEEQRAIVVGFFDPDQKDQINASRIIVLPVPPSDLMKKQLSNDEVPTSTGSAGKVQPIVK